MTDREWAAALELALNGALSCSTAHSTPGVWLMAQRMARHLPVTIAFVAGALDHDEVGALKQVSVSLK